MTEEQIKYVEAGELALAAMVLDGHDKLASTWHKILAYLQNGEPEMAVLEGEAINIPKEVLDEIRKKFDIRY